MNRIESPNQIPQTGIAVLLCQVDARTPCKKFYNEMSHCIDELMKDVTAQYFVIELNADVKSVLRVSYLPTVIVYKDGKETKRFNGHYWSKFQINAFIREGL